MTEISIGIAFIGGLVSFFSPCIFPLIPAYLAQLTGTNVSSGMINADRKIIFSRSLGFIMGFTIIFILLGASSTLIGEWFRQYGNVIQQIGGIIIILFGLQMTGLISIRSLLSEKRISKGPKKATSFTGSVGFGLAFASGWTPCVGLVLGSILYMASEAETMFTGMGMLFVYSMGLGIPFLVVSLIFTKSIQKLSRINHWLPIIQRASGIIMLILGVLLFTGYFQVLANYLGSFVPSWMMY